MWISAIRLTVETENAPNAGTDQLVTTSVLRDGNEVARLRLDYPAENDLERGAVRNYDYFGLARRNDQTEELPDGIGRNPMPYPDAGIEFSSGVAGHMKLRLQIHGDDLWIKDRVKLYVKQIRQQATSFDTLGWVEDEDWSHLATWDKDVPMSTDFFEGVGSWKMQL